MAATSRLKETICLEKMGFRSCTDKRLCDWIVKEQPGWGLAFNELFIDRYGYILKCAGRMARPSLPIEQVLERVRAHLREPLDGTPWKRLQEWDPKQVRFAPWLLHLTRHLLH